MQIKANLIMAKPSNIAEHSIVELRAVHDAKQSQYRLGVNKQCLVTHDTETSSISIKRYYTTSMQMRAC